MPDARINTERINTVLCDLDGVVWLSEQPIAGSVDAIDRLRRSGRRVLFVTNNSRATIGEQERTLSGVGIPAAGDVVTSAMAAAELLDVGDRVLVVGGPGVTEAVALGGAHAIENTGDVHDERMTGVDVVTVGLHRDFDFARLNTAARAIRNGARFIATNSDATYPTPDGLEPGGGAIVAAVSTASGTDPQIAGKPHAPMADVIRRIVAPDGKFDPPSVVMVGDRPETDGLFAATLGAHYAQVRTGVLGPHDELPDGIDVAFDVADLAGLADALTVSVSDR